MTTKQIQDVNYRTVYVASDGREFDNAEECRIYERSYACAMKSYLKDMSIRETCNEDDLFYTGNCQTEVFIVLPKSKEDILRIKQIAIGFGGSEEKVNKWIDDSDINSVILVTIGYNNEWVYVSRLNNILKNIVGEKYKLVPTTN